ncbi:MAG: RNA polymerase sigma factor [Anaerolineae bacterium]
MTSITDNLLLERIGQGDQASFDAVFHQHYDRVYGLLFRLVGNRTEAEDLTQETFLKLYDHSFRRRLFRSGRTHNIGAWLYRVATNMGYNAIRGRQRRWQRNTLLVPDPQGAPGTEQEAVKREPCMGVAKTFPDNKKIKIKNRKRFFISHLFYKSTLKDSVMTTEQACVPVLC